MMSRRVRRLRLVVRTSPSTFPIEVESGAVRSRRSPTARTGVLFAGLVPDPGRRSTATAVTTATIRRVTPIAIRRVVGRFAEGAAGGSTGTGDGSRRAKVTGAGTQDRPPRAP